MKIENFQSLHDLNIPNASRLALLFWYDGKDVKSLFPKVTFYRHRQVILKAVGVDISLPFVQQNKNAQRVLAGIEELKALEIQPGEVDGIIQRSLFGAQR